MTTIPNGLTESLIKVNLKLLERVQVQGNEVEAFVAVRNALMEELTLLAADGIMNEDEVAATSD